MSSPKFIAMSLVLHGALATGITYLCQPLAINYGQTSVVKLRLWRGKSHDSPITTAIALPSQNLQGATSKLPLQSFAPQATISSNRENVGVLPGKPSGAPGQAPLLVRESVSEPSFTPDALSVGFRGSLVLDLKLDEFGRVISATLRNPSGLKIDAEAIASASTARYLPARDDQGRPVASTAELRFQFVGH